MVYGREIDGKTTTFGTTGYTMNNVFVLYDRDGESGWYPTGDKHLEATSGPKKGRRIEFIDKPAPMPLGDWRKKYPNTKVLVGKGRTSQRTPRITSDDQDVPGDHPKH